MCTWPAASRGLKSDFNLDHFDIGPSISVQQNRRRKKRPSYGVRTVEIERGRCGYGFTISGQAPCILSCIVSNSPAERAGLRPGDYLIAVNSKNVSKALHDDVVRLIGTSSGLLKLQIAENYYSDSSDDDELVTVLRSKPKYPNRRHRQQRQHRQVHRAEKVLQDLHAGLLFQVEDGDETWKNVEFKNATDAQLMSARIFGKEIQEKQQLPQQNLKNRPKKNLKQDFSIEDELKTFLYPSLRQIQGNFAAGCGKSNDESEEMSPRFIYRAVIGYLGTIEMPKQLQLPGNRLQAIRNCIRRLRVEKKVHTLVLLTVYKEKVTLTNSRGLTIAEYPAEKITYSGIYANDKKFFGLVTSYRPNDENVNEFKLISSSCHVFMIDSKMIFHQNHQQRAKMFNINCMGDFDSKCAEFPDSADPILDAISTLSRNYNNDAELMQNSNTNTSSSNSDSGIGFRDEFHLNNDRVFVVEVGEGSNLFKTSREIALEKLRLSSASVPPIESKNRPPSDRRLTVRAMPDPVLGLPSKVSSNFERSSFRKYLPSKSSEKKNCSQGDGGVINLQSSKRQQEVEESNLTLRELKLSPKVYGVAYPSKLTGSDILAGTVMSGSVFSGSRSSPDNESVVEKEGSQDVHPPTQDDDEDDESEFADDISLQINKRWIRSSSLQRQFSKSPYISSESGALSDGELTSGKLSSGSSMLAVDSNCASSEIGCQVGRVASWACNFEKLLEDPAGIHTFDMFLKKEFSHENIHFWIACERFHNFATTEELMKSKAMEIYERHLCLGAMEPVNVDSQARQIAEDGLENPNRKLFIQAQRQIYNLMKFDCYGRFLKSSIYKDCIVKEMAGELLPFLGDENLDPSLPYKDQIMSKEYGKKFQDDSDEKRRKSLLSWNRTKSCKKQDVVVIGTRNNETRKSGWKKKKEKSNENVTDVNGCHGSHSSLTSGDLFVMQRQASSRESLSERTSNEERTLCRVVLPDKSTTVVQTRVGQSVKNVLQHLLTRRGIIFTAMDVFAGEKLIDSSDDSSVLGCQEIIVEERLLYRIVFPNKKSVVVKSKTVGNVNDNIRPIVIRFGFKMENIVITFGNDRLVDLQADIQVIDKQIVIVQCKEKYSEWGSEAVIRRCARSADDVWIRIIEDIMEGKVRPQWDEFDTWDLENFSYKVEGRSTLERRTTGGILGLGRRNSLHFERDVGKKLKNKLSVGNRASVHESFNHRIVQVSVDKTSLQRQKKQSESDEMYKVWDRAQRSRLDDQRGTEINFELPDFLKPNPPENKKYDESLVRRSEDDGEVNSLACFSGESIIPTTQQAEEFFGKKSARLSPDENFTFRQDVLLNLVSRPSSQPTPLNVTIKSPQTRSLPSPPLPNVFTPSTCANLDSEKKNLPINDDDLLSPSQIPPPPPPDEGNTSLHVEEANFTPPPPIVDVSRNLQIPNTPPETPPPLPPKPKCLPPRRNIEFFRTNIKSGNENYINHKSSGSSNNGVHVIQQELINQKGRSRKAMYIEREGNEKLNVSFI